MFNKTDNSYKFQYLQTGITGPGIDAVFLPPIPSDDKIIFRKEQKWIRPRIPDQLKKWVREWKQEQQKNPNYIHAQHQQIIDWETQEWERSTNGCWFWNDGNPTYITPFYYWYLTAWQTYFGYPIYRETDKEITYWIQYWEEDPDAYGGALNTIRRYGKSSIMGAWIIYRATRNFNHNAGMQGETDQKIKKFYKKMVLKPFYKLPYYYQPTFNTDTKQTNQIEFDEPPQRGQKVIQLEEVEVLESMVDFRPSESGQYDGDVLNSYISEEPGKLLKTSIYNEEGEGTWDIVKPCLRKGRQIRGKAFFGTTVENMTISDKGGRAYKELFYDSDFNQRQADGRTKSGLYAAFLPGDCAYEDYLDEHGRPMRREAREQLMLERKSFENNPRKLAGLIRKYPLSVMEIFYVSPDRCEFNAITLQERLEEIDTSPVPLTSRIDLFWENGKRLTKVRYRHNPTGGWCHVSEIPPEQDLNRVDRRYDSGIGDFIYFPLNDHKFASGLDPIQHGSNQTGRESRPVQLVKSKYDSSIDGQWTYEEHLAMSKKGKFVDGKWVLDPEGKKYQYKTNRYFLMMDSRPTDPNVFFERVLLICWWLGISVHVEKQFGGAVMAYLHNNRCGDFIFGKYKPDHEKPDKFITDGTNANPTIIQEYTAAYAGYIELFGHTIPFRPQCEDALIFDAAHTTIHDYTVAGGLTEMACKMRPKVIKPPILDLDQYLPSYHPYTGNPYYRQTEQKSVSLSDQNFLSQ